MKCYESLGGKGVETKLEEKQSCKKSLKSPIWKSLTRNWLSGEQASLRQKGMAITIMVCNLSSHYCMRQPPLENISKERMNELRLRA